MSTEPDEKKTPPLFGKVSAEQPCPHCGSQGEDGSTDLNMGFPSLASSAGTLPGSASMMQTQTSGLSKWEQDTFRDIINNVNNTLRFQIQLAVPILAGCVTALNLVPPQEHQEFLNNFDRWVFIPVLLSMALSYYGLEMHWVLDENKPSENVETLAKVVKRKYLMMHSAIILQALGLILLIIFVLLEYK